MEHMAGIDIVNRSRGICIVPILFSLMFSSMFFPLWISVSAIKFRRRSAGIKMQSFFVATCA